MFFVGLPVEPSLLTLCVAFWVFVTCSNCAPNASVRCRSRFAAQSDAGDQSGAARRVRPLANHVLHACVLCAVFFARHTGCVSPCLGLIADADPNSSCRQTLLSFRQFPRSPRRCRYVSEQTNYHHGEASLHGTIVNMAQACFVFSANLASCRLRRLLYVLACGASVCLLAALIAISFLRLVAA
jgi:hypothetical protein